MDDGLYRDMIARGELITKKEAARIMGYSPPMIGYLAKEKKRFNEIYVGRKSYLFRDEIEAANEERRQKITEKTVEKIKALRKQGLKQNDIATEMNLSQSSVSRILQEEKKVTECVTQRVKELYGLGVSQMSIAHQMNLSVSTIKKIIKNTPQPFAQEVSDDFITSEEVNNLFSVNKIRLRKLAKDKVIVSVRSKEMLYSKKSVEQYIQGVKSRLFASGQEE